jgi:hypothetical protein
VLFNLFGPSSEELLDFREGKHSSRTRECDDNTELIWSEEDASEIIETSI